ncbi:hypothetical protein FLM48_11905 [Shewanella sp. Scap07]|uniref:hypothetical protein n=1 Tax=Shewanella sp. Scap07 TaxID=2589987 RepID=UPI0015C14AB2|nr:hypothetical protein [Shewanella sp. Scap07]QLE85710.1 hypothetical protein FLM48_11905 [Shewanella sp. Scap07]
MDGVTNLQLATFSIAVLGAVLGIINTWHNLDKKRLKVKVTPLNVVPVGGLDPRLRFGVSIVNLSDFPITVSDAGVLVKETGDHMAIVNPVFSDGGNWPRRLEPRSSVTAYSQVPTPPQGKSMGLAYARTECGALLKGNSAALKQIAREQNS